MFYDTQNLEWIDIVHFVVNKNMSEKNIFNDIASDARELLSKNPADHVLQLQPEALHLEIF